MVTPSRPLIVIPAVQIVLRIHTYITLCGAIISQSPIGWIKEYMGQGEWIPELNVYVVRL